VLGVENAEGATAMIANRTRNGHKAAHCLTSSALACLALFFFTMNVLAQTQPDVGAQTQPETGGQAQPESDSQMQQLTTPISQPLPAMGLADSSNRMYSMEKPKEDSRNALGASQT